MPRSLKLKKQHIELVEKYLESRKENWTSKKTYQTSFYAAHEILRWLSQRGLHENELTRELIEEFIRGPVGKQTSKTYQKHRRNQLRRYLLWRQSVGQLKIDLSGLLPTKRQLCVFVPELGREFIEDREHIKKKTFNSYRAAIGRFHEWLDKHNIVIGDVNESHVLEFDNYLREKNAGNSQRAKCNQRLRTYLEWLHKREIVKLNNPKICVTVRQLGKRFKFELPKETEPFLEFASINLKVKTVANYRSALEHLYSFLSQEKVGIEDLKREHFERWLQSLKTKGLGPTWRKSLIICTRYYLFWLGEHGQITAEVDTLLRMSDTPKLPQYLPKPLAPQEDFTLQAKLAQSSSVYHKALLLIRLTGMRIGEAVDLPVNCIWQDHAGHRYLKIPLGKLDKERMVPVSEKVFELVNWQSERTRAINGGAFKDRLMVQENGQPLSLTILRQTLHSAVRESEILEWVNVHRLRHTYATSLLNGGMSLLGVMKVLGHHSMRMTLRYAAVSPETVRAEYLSAISKIEQRHDIQSIVDKIRNDESDPNVSASFTELTTLVRRLGFEKDINHDRMKLLVKRIRRLQSEVEQLLV